MPPAAARSCAILGTGDMHAPLGGTSGRGQPCRVAMLAMWKTHLCASTTDSGTLSDRHICSSGTNTEHAQEHGRTEIEEELQQLDPSQYMGHVRPPNCQRSSRDCSTARIRPSLPSPELAPRRCRVIGSLTSSDSSLGHSCETCGHACHEEELQTGRPYVCHAGLSPRPRDQQLNKRPRGRLPQFGLLARAQHPWLRTRDFSSATDSYHHIA